MLISVLQIKAARALLGWSQRDLAKHSGLDKGTIARLERPNSNSRGAYLSRIVETLEQAGVEFTNRNGVREREEGVQTLVGRAGFEHFRKEVLTYARSGAADICVSNVDERLFEEWGKGPVNEAYRKEMRYLFKKHSRSRFRILVKEGYAFQTALGYGEYRTVPEKDFGYFPFYVYGDKTALIIFDQGRLRILNFHFPLLAHYHREEFDDRWRAACPAGASE